VFINSFLIVFVLLYFNVKYKFNTIYIIIRVSQGTKGQGGASFTNFQNSGGGGKLIGFDRQFFGSQKNFSNFFFVIKVLDFQDFCQNHLRNLKGWTKGKI